MTTITRISALSLLVAVGLAAPTTTRADHPVGPHVKGACNIGQRDRVRYFAGVFNGQLTKQNAWQAARRAADHVSRSDITHKRLWDYHNRKEDLPPGTFLVIGYVDTNSGRFGFMATDLFRRIITHDYWGSANGWVRRHWRLTNGGRVYLQVGHGQGHVRYQFDGA